MKISKFETSIFFLEILCQTKCLDTIYIKVWDTDIALSIYTDTNFSFFPEVLKEEGKKFERKKVWITKKSNFFSLELFSSTFFLVHMEAEVLQQWQTTHFKELNDKIAQFNWIWQRKFVLKCNVIILKTIINLPNI